MGKAGNEMMRVPVVLAGVVFLLAAASAARAQESAYDEFNRFCIASFGAEKEPMWYEQAGRELKLVEDGAWQHVSVNSACLAWETNLPAKGFVEFGETADYGKKTVEDERPFCVHVHYLKDLKPDTTYHYRMVSVDEQGKRIATPDATFKTGKLDGMVCIPDDVAGPPFTLDKADATYVVTRDIVCDASAFNITARNITLDLNGHTVTYNEKADAVEDRPAGGYIAYALGGPVGIRTSYGARPTKLVVNGEIRQGKGASSGEGGGMRSAPFCGTTIDEIAGVTVRYSGPQVSGVVGATRVAFHHNVIVDEGTVIINRHMGCAACRATAPKTHHNLVKRCRHRGFDGVGGSEFYHNEIYGDSWDTNAAGVMYYNKQNVDCHGNRIFGRGYMFIGVAVVSKGCRDVRVHDNFINLVSEKPNRRSDEYGEMSNMSGLRFTPYGGDAENIRFENNVISLEGKGGGKLRGLWVCPTPTSRDVSYVGNVVKVMVDRQNSNNAQCVCVNGNARSADAPVILYEGNTFISNICNVRLAESYGSSGNQRFVRNELVRVGDDPRYKTIRCGWWISPTTGNVFVDTVFKGGAGFDVVSFEGGPVELKGKDAETHGRLKGDRDFAAAWTVTVKTAPGALVTVADVEGRHVFASVADDKGVARAVVSQYRHQGKGAKGEGETVSDSEKIVFTPHTVTVKKDGKTAERKVDVDRAMEVELPL